MSNNQKWAVHLTTEAEAEIEAFKDRFPVFGPKIIALYDNQLRNNASSGKVLQPISPTTEIRFFYDSLCCDEGEIVCYLVYELTGLTAKILSFEATLKRSEDGG